MAPSNEVLGTQEAARRLGVSVRTVQLWVENGTLDAWKTPGGHRRVLRSSVEAALRSRDQATRPDDNEPLRVLIVEDDLAMQGYYVALFEVLRPDAELTMAADGFEGLVELGKVAPQLMLVDVDMPGMDGITMLGRIVQKDIGDGVTIAVVTGLTKDQLEQRGGVPASIPVYPKPLSVERLKDLLERAVPAVAERGR
ncbi:MAG: excisionase family DNA-binding protein [Gammaproteobacteria bacterium]|nr:excisionase family DNA-binding protein [Gammaproteobacteria bacterium]